MKLETLKVRQDEIPNDDKERPLTIRIVGNTITLELSPPKGTPSIDDMWKPGGSIHYK